MKKNILLISFALISFAFRADSQNICLKTNNDFISANGALGVGNPKYLCKGDFNEDGILDIITSNTTSASLSLFLGTGNGLFVFQDTIAITPTAPTSTPNGIVSADFNNDSHADFALVKRISSAFINFRVMIGDGLGGFSTYVDMTCAVNNPTDLVAGDFDNNGTIDVVVMSGASPGTLSFLSNNGTGFNAGVTSTPAGLGLPYYAKAGFFDNDAFLDIIFTRDSPGKLVFMKGTGTFTNGFNMTIGTGPRDLALADLNGDTFLDAAVALNGSDSVVVAFSNGLGAISSTVTYFSGGDGPQSIAIGDIDGDLDDDIVVANLTDFTVGVLKNNGSGVFNLTRHHGFKDPQEIILGNFDSDSNLDIVFTSAGTKNLMYMGNNGAGDFISYDAIFDPAILSRPNSTAAGDFNNDGLGDVVIANTSTNTFELYTGNGAGAYALTSSNPTAASLPNNIQAAYVNGDLNLDVIVLENGAPQLSIYLGNGSGTFSAPTSIALPAVPSYLLVRDFDGDNDPDIAIAYASNNTFSVYRNNAGTYSLVTTHSTGINAPTSIDVASINADANVDLVICNSGSNSIVVYTGTGACNFSSGSTAAVSASPDVAMLGDINGDGNVDVAVCYGTTSVVSYLYGDGAGNFGAATNLTVTAASSIASLVVEDFNLDGFADVIAASNGAHDVSVLLGSGAGLTYQAAFYCGYKPVHISKGDINGDNLVDIFVANSDIIGGASSVTPIINRSAVITNSGSNSICSGQSVTLTSTPAYSYLWSTSATTQAISVNSSNSYTVTQTNYNSNCSSVSLPKVITVNPLPTVTGITGNTTICSGTSTTLTASTSATTPDVFWWDASTGGTMLQNGATYTTPNLVANTSYYVEVTDLSTGCSSTPRFQVNVVIGDVTPPVFTSCPSNISVSASAGTCAATVTWTAPTATDNCGSPVITQTAGAVSGSSFPVGVTTITFTATDGNSNTATCTFTITVNDTQSPTINSCPSNISVSNTPGSCGATVNWTAPTVTDNCSGATISLTSGSAPGSFFPIGVTTIVYTATDANSNTATCSFTVTVNDNEAPVISNCPSNITSPNDAGSCGAIVTWTAPTASDNCPGQTISQTAGPASGSLFPIGTTTITYTATDASSNVATCTFTVTVTDTQLPVFSSCPSNVTLTNDVGVCGRTFTFSNPSATDNCPGVTVVQTAGPASGTVFPIGTTTLTFTATDASGNTATCTYTVTITDSQNPVINGLSSNISLSTTAGTCSAVANWTAPTVSDNCSGASITQTAGLPSGSTFPLGITVITYTATDASGNTATGSFNVNVIDATPPTFSNCPTNFSVCENDVVTFGTPNATDNCSGAVTVTQISGPPSGTVFPLGSNTIVFRATDASGNFTNCTFTVQVNAAPVVSFNFPITSACQNEPLISITGGSPSGGIYTGNGVSGATFDPSAVSPGYAVITYTVTNGNGCSALANDSLNVHAAPNVTFTINDNAACVNHTAFTISGGSPTGGTYSGTGISAGVFTPSVAGAGNHTITYVFTDANNCTAQATDVVAVSSCVGVDEIDDALGFNLFPNPNNGNFTIEFNEPIQSAAAVEIYNLVGQMIFTTQINQSPFSVNLDHITNGTYIVFVSSDGTRSMKKIIIER